MEQSGGGRSSWMDNFSRDLLLRFRGSSSSSSSKEAEPDPEEEEIELNLGLSLGGRFGVDKSCGQKLVRSSSVATCLPTVRDDDAVAPAPVAYPRLVRTSSLPAETEEEWRKRKELQTLRRMAAKRRRSEKQRLNKGDTAEMEQGKRETEVNLLASKRFRLSPYLPTLAAVVGQESKSRAAEQPTSQGSVESRGRSSSTMSELETKPPQASGEASPGKRGGDNTDVGSSGGKGETESSSGRADATGLEMGMNSLEDMPCVFTKGDGPNGRRVDGILYKYGKGEEVKIMCVCHGSFLSPAEFVKHASGRDVAQPLKHIVINPNSSL